ncbi:hypothetical protein ACSBR1_016268 [Camellia fascicularis]
MKSAILVPYRSLTACPRIISLMLLFLRLMGTAILTSNLPNLLKKPNQPKNSHSLMVAPEITVMTRVILRSFQILALVSATLGLVMIMGLEMKTMCLKLHVGMA